MLAWRQMAVCAVHLDTEHSHAQREQRRRPCTGCVAVLHEWPSSDVSGLAPPGLVAAQLAGWHTVIGNCCDAAVAKCIDRLHGDSAMDITDTIPDFLFHRHHRLLGAGSELLVQQVQLCQRLSLPLHSLESTSLVVLPTLHAL